MHSEHIAAAARAAFDYDPAEGIVRWKSGQRLQGAVAGTAHSGGYIAIWFLNKYRKAHRICWLLVNGEWPRGELDHINGVKTDNRIANLRIVTRAQNMQNHTKARRDNKLGLRGVSPSGNRFLARIQVGGEATYLGTFANAMEARAAYLKAKESLHVFR